MDKAALVELTKQVARERGYPPEILCALAEKESADWNQGAYRYEPDYGNLQNPRDYSRSGRQSDVSEIIGQKMSWGLTQIMGATARRFGFKGDFFTDICIDPYLALNLSCDHLDRDAPHPLNTRLARYNGGLRGNPDVNGNLRNREYVEDILTRAEKYL